MRVIALLVMEKYNGSMAIIISLINQKGGVGKTTSAINLSAYLTLENKSVLLVDLDPQGNASSGLGLDVRSLEQGLYEAIMSGRNIDRFIIRTPEYMPDILPASQNLAGASVELVHLENREYRLYEVLRQIRTQYDFIIIDSPPSLGLLTINGLVASDEIIIPVQTEYFALEGLSQLLETIMLVKENLQPEIEVMGALLTMYDRRNRLARQVMKEVQEHFPAPVFETVIPRSIRLAEAPSFGKSIFHFDSFSKGARSYRNLAREVVLKSQQRSVPKS